MFCFPEEGNQQSILNWFINLLISLKLCKSKVDFNANLNCFFFGSIDSTGYFNLCFGFKKKRRNSHGKKGRRCVKPISQQTVNAWCPCTTLKPCAKIEILKKCFFFSLRIQHLATLVSLEQLAANVIASLVTSFSKRKHFFCFALKTRCY